MGSQTPTGRHAPIWNKSNDSDQSFTQAVNSGSYASASSNNLTAGNGGTYASRAAAQGSGALDLSDFPALGSGTNTGTLTPPIRNNYPDISPQQPGAFVQAAKAGLYAMNSDGNLTPGLQGRRSDDHPDDFPSLQSAHKVSDLDKVPQSDMDRYGLNGLLGVLRMENNDQTAVAIGNDLTSMGLNFAPTSEPLSKTFASPWVETSRHQPIPEYSLPSCYVVPSAVPQQQKIQNFSDETLFYIFYTMPKDGMQEAVAMELSARNWRYHKELKLWLTKDPLNEPIQQTAQVERGIYTFFDPSIWERVKKEYALYYPDIA